MDKFEQASRINLEVPVNEHTVVSVNSLWMLPMSSKSRVSLESIAIFLYNELKGNDVPDFLAPKSKTSNTLQLSYDIVKHVIEVRQAEQVAAVSKAEKQSQIKLMREAIAAKKTETMLSGDLEELEKRLKLLESE